MVATPVQPRVGNRTVGLYTNIYRLQLLIVKVVKVGRVSSTCPAPANVTSSSGGKEMSRLAGQPAVTVKTGE